MGMTVSWMLVAAAIAAFCITAVSGIFLIPALHRLHFGQTIRESGPVWHNKKQGTTTMGGFCFILGVLLAVGLAYVGLSRLEPGLLEPQQLQASLLVLFLAFGSGFIGFLDDFTKVVRHRNLGLLAWQKLVLQFAVAAAYLVSVALAGGNTATTIPFVGKIGRAHV